jgi:hypothetical protein
MAWKRGSEVDVGDILEFLGNHHRITQIRPYEGKLARLFNGEARTAKASDGWGITLDPGMLYEVL